MRQSLRGLATLAGIAARANPYVRALTLAWKLYERVQRFNPEFDLLSQSWVPGGGWSKVQDCSGAKPGMEVLSGTTGYLTGPFTCLVNQSTVGFRVPNVDTIPTSWRTMHSFNRRQPLGHGDRFQSWNRPVAGAVTPWAPPGVWPRSSPYPWWNPMELPISRPVGNPRARPLYGPRARPDLNPNHRFQRQPARAPRVALRVDVATTITAGRPPSLSVRPAGRPKPPGRGEREKKFQGPGGLTRLGYVLAVSAFDKVTEVEDFVDALFQALPKARQRQYGRDPRLQDKVGAVWNHASELAPGQALANLLHNAVEDFIIGGSQGLAGKRLRSVGARRGLTASWGSVLSA